MSIKNAIINAPVHFIEKKFLNEGDNIAIIRYQGEEYHGAASCHEDDEDFYSDKIGKTIAHMRAMKNAMIAERDNAKRDWKTLKHAYDNAMQNIPMEKRLNCHEDNFLMAVYKAENRYKKYSNYVKEINKEIISYLNDQNKVIDFLKRKRALEKANLN